MITRDKFVSVSYELRTTQEGEPMEIADENQPLTFICGNGQTLESFEMNLLGLNTGDAFNFRIPAAQAYGEINEDMIMDLPREMFAELPADQLTVGTVLNMQDSLGRRMPGKIIAVSDNEVRMDLNGPMAGVDLYFKGKVLEVRDATEEELNALNQSQCGGCSGCGSSDGCGSGGCGC